MSGVSCIVCCSVVAYRLRLLARSCGSRPRVRGSDPAAILGAFASSQPSPHPPTTHLHRPPVQNYLLPNPARPFPSCHSTIYLSAISHIPHSEQSLDINPTFRPSPSPIVLRSLPSYRSQAIPYLSISAHTALSTRDGQALTPFHPPFDQVSTATSFRSFFVPHIWVGRS